MLRSGFCLICGCAFFAFPPSLITISSRGHPLIRTNLLFSLLSTRGECLDEGSSPCDISVRVARRSYRTTVARLHAPPLLLLFLAHVQCRFLRTKYIVALFPIQQAGCSVSKGTRSRPSLESDRAILLQPGEHNILPLCHPILSSRHFSSNSGSMCVTTAVEGRLALRGDRTKDLNHLLTAEVSLGVKFSGNPLKAT